MAGMTLKEPETALDAPNPAEPEAELETGPEAESEAHREAEPQGPDAPPAAAMESAAGSGVEAQAGAQTGDQAGDQASDQASDQAGAPTEAPATAQDMAALSRRVEAALMVSDRPVPAARLVEAVGGAANGVNVKAIRAAVRSLNDFYDSSKRSFRIEELAGGYQLVTLPEHREVVAAMTRSKAQTRLTGAALETLAIIAYKQPILRAQLEAIRGVACGEVLRSLMERRLVKIVGRSEEIGRPMLYGTTKAFLEWFGLAQLKDLPKIEDFARLKQGGESGGGAAPTGSATGLPPA